MNRATIGRPTSPQPGAVSAGTGLPARAMRELPCTPGSRWWWLGCHGGAGTTTLQGAVPGGSDAWRYWPDPEISTPDCAVVLVARTHASGLRAAQAAARQWAAAAVPEGVKVLGLVAVADAPGRLPRPLRELLHLVGGGLPQVWELPWVESLRRGDPPATARLPRAFAALAADLTVLTQPTTLGGS